MRSVAERTLAAAKTAVLNPAARQSALFQATLGARNVGQGSVVSTIGSTLTGPSIGVQSLWYASAIASKASPVSAAAGQTRSASTLVGGAAVAVTAKAAKAAAAKAAASKATAAKAAAGKVGVVDMIAYGFVAGMVFSVGYVMYEAYFKPREVEVYAKALELDDSIATATSPEKFSMPAEESKADRGSLDNKIITHRASGDTFLMKGASSRFDLVKEYFISNALNMMRAGQPKALLLQDRSQGDSAGTARFYSLSHMQPNTMDLQKFIENGGIDKIKEKPLIGLEVALASIGLFANQQDCKYANLIVREFDDRFEVYAIDHEKAFVRFISHNHRELTTDFDQLGGYIRDMHPKGCELPPLGMIDDPRAAAFLEAAKTTMDAERIVDFYRAAASTDLAPLFSELEAIAAKSGIVTAGDISYFRKEAEAIKSEAQAFVDNYDASHDVRTAVAPS